MLHIWTVIVFTHLFWETATLQKLMWNTEINGYEIFQSRKNNNAQTIMQTEKVFKNIETNV